MSPNKKALQSEQAKQFSQLLKDYGITGKVGEPSRKERKKIDELFPDQPATSRKLIATSRVICNNTATRDAAKKFSYHRINRLGKLISKYCSQEEQLSVRCQPSTYLKFEERGKY